MPGPITNFYLANGAKLSEVLILLHKMKTRIWNTFAKDQVVFHIRVYTVLFVDSYVPPACCRAPVLYIAVAALHMSLHVYGF